MTHYPERYAELQTLVGRLAKDVPGPMAGFAQLHKHSQADGVLPAKTKELMALSISIAVRCEGCIAYHGHDALKAGATRAEVLETIGVALMMGGGPALMYGCDALQALDQFSVESA